MPEERFKTFRLCQMQFNEHYLLTLAGPLSTIVAEDSEYYRLIKLAEINHDIFYDNVFERIIATIMKTNTHTMRDLLILLEQDQLTEVFTLKSPVAPIKQYNILKIGIVLIKADPDDRMKFTSDNDKYKIRIMNSVKLGSKELEQIKRYQGMK